MSDVFDPSLDELSQSRYRQSQQEKEAFQLRQRNNLREFAVQLREVEENPHVSPGSLNQPSFALGSVPDFPGKLENLPMDPERGHLSKDSHDKIMSSLLKASESKDVATRDRHTRSAAKEAAKDFLSKKGFSPSNSAESKSLVQELKGQVTANIRNIAESLGMSKVSSAALAYSLERSLELEGFKALVNKSLEKASNYMDSKTSTPPTDKTPTNSSTRSDAKAPDVRDDLDNRTRQGSSDFSKQGASFKDSPNRGSPSAARLVELNEAPNTYRGSTGSAASGIGLRHNLERTLNNSVNWLAEKGIDRNTVRRVMDKHLGKLHVVAEVAQHRDVLMKTASVIANSDTTVKAIADAASDREVREAVGNVMVAAGTDTKLPGARGVSSIAVATGSALRGDSWQEVSRNVFRAAMAAAGAAAGGFLGGMASAGTMALPGAVVGGEFGTVAGDKVLEIFDKVTGREPNSTTVSKEELDKSIDLLKQKASEADIPGKVTQDFTNQTRKMLGDMPIMEGALGPNREAFPNLRGATMEGDFPMANPNKETASPTKQRESAPERSFEMSSSR